MKSILVVCCIAVFSFSLPVFAVETSMTQEAKQQALDSLAVYEEKQITQLSAQNTQSDQAVQEGVFCPDKSCVDVQRPAQSDEVYSESKSMVHRVLIYFANNVAFVSGYNDLTEGFFTLKGVELSTFKQTALYHYLGHDVQKLKGQLVFTTKDYVGIEIGVTHSELKELTESDTRVLNIKHKGNSGSVISY